VLTLRKRVLPAQGSAGTVKHNIDEQTLRGDGYLPYRPTELR